MALFLRYNTLIEGIVLTIKLIFSGLLVFFQSYVRFVCQNSSINLVYVFTFHEVFNKFVNTKVLDSNLLHFWIFCFEFWKQDLDVYPESIKL